MEKNSKIILTGYRATGKSAVGRMLARRLGLDFIDMDQTIEEAQGCTIQKMVAEKGWPYFRSLERQLLQELVPQSNLVVATGGGAILHQDIWQRLMDTGLCVWLTADIQTICDRLSKDANTKAQRPSLTGKGTWDEIKDMLAEREPLYRQGTHITIDTSGRSPDDIVCAIEEALTVTSL